MNAPIGHERINVTQTLIFSLGGVDDKLRATPRRVFCMKSACTPAVSFIPLPLITFSFLGHCIV